MRRPSVLSAGVGLAILLFGGKQASAQPSLGTAASFAVLGSSTVTNTGATTVAGNLGVGPGSAITGFPPGIVVGGTIHTADATALQAQADAATAYTFLAGQPCGTTLTGQDLGGKTLTPGVYCFSTSAQLTGILTLDAQSNPNAVFIIQTGSTLTTASASLVQVINGGQNCNVFWAIGSSATLGSTTTLVGNILAVASVTLNTGARINGRAIAQNGAVTLDANTVDASASACPASAPVPPSTIPTLDFAGLGILVALLSVAALLVLNRSSS
ncbi:MAG: ice-binding family protein [Acidobacteriota bacterium]